MKNALGPRTMLIGLVVGVLSVPALVFAATSLVEPDQAPESAPVTTVATAPSVSSVSEPAPVTTETPTSATADDLARACGEEGLVLVAAEEAGTIDALGQAALDALRPICEEAGRPLPVPPVPEPVVVVETVEASAPVPAAAAVDHDDDEWDDDHDEDDDHDDDEWEDHDEDDDDDHEDEDDDHDDEDD